MKRSVILSYILALVIFIAKANTAMIPAQYELTDTVMLDEVSVTAIKTGTDLNNKAQASTHISFSEIEQAGIVSLRGMSDMVPNFYVPEYGSKITSSIYVRGLGARMDQPAVGMNVDNIPIMNKDAYDFDMSDIVAVDMIRGPQSILYGRNAIAGVLNVSTLSPLDYQGLRLFAEGGNGGYLKVNLGWYAKIGGRTGISISGGYSRASGFFRNVYDNEKIDKYNAGSGRLRLDHVFSSRLKLQNILSVNNLHQGGYPYESVESGLISHNDTCFYRRFLLNDGLTIKWLAEKFTFTSITSVQHINDNLTLDQDFLPLDYFTLTQKKRETAVTQDIVIKGTKDQYSWLAGVFGFYKHLNMLAPVTFKETGISRLIEEHRNDANPDYPIRWDERIFPLDSDFKISTFGVAAYHQSTLDLGRWHFNAGIRLDYERANLDYISRCNTSYSVYHPYPDVFSNVKLDIDVRGKLHQDFLQLLPSIGAVFDIDSYRNNVYANVSKGYKAGGFNTQMFSEVLQQRLMNMMGVGSTYSVADIVEYKPEESWNFEVGAHYNFPTLNLNTQIALFYILCHNQQLTMFPEGNTTGRIMTNAGRTRSYGAELQLNWNPLPSLNVNMSYGYTNVKFLQFNNGKVDYKGKHLPYAPQNTLFIQALWNREISQKFVQKIEIGVNLKGAGRIYWNEANTLWQNLYVLPGATATAFGKGWSFQIWGRNLSSTKYYTFYFESIGNEFLQRGNPLTFGATLRIDI